MIRGVGETSIIVMLDLSKYRTIALSDDTREVCCPDGQQIPMN